ncbi:MAG TPA: hypothetical protein VFR78_00970 [Pyrinomonadaceae bacterium]|nr:hypothetical protein [Pyrinomonadaceae bacterium]
MWKLDNLEIKPATLDFSSSGQAKREVSQLFSNGIELINALELVDWDPDHTQFLICEECGFVHCEPGGGVGFRKSGPLVLMLPAEEYVWGERQDKQEYRPPPYLTKRGIPYLTVSTYEDLRSMHSSFPAVDQIRDLNLREAALLFHWTAPLHILGDPPVISTRRDIVTGSSEGDYVEPFDRLEDLLRAQYEDKSPAHLRAPLSNERVVSFYLQAAEFVQWDALVFDGSEYRLLVDSTYVIAPR